jgi:hypothetical protein
MEQSDILALTTHEVVDRDGKSVGYVECVFNDRKTGKPEWLGVMTGTFRNHHVLVPVSDVERAKGSVAVPWTKEEIVSAPDYGKPETSISEEMEHDAYRHYGIEPSPAP